MYNETKFTYEVADNQEGLFTKNHTRFDCKLEYNNIVFCFPYQCNTSYTTPCKRDVMECVISDAFAYENSIDILDFVSEFGYADEQHAREAYKGCKEAYEKLKAMYGEKYTELIEELEEE